MNPLVGGLGIIWESIDYYFTIMLRYTIALIAEGEYGIAAITMVLQICAWLVFVFVFKVGFFDIVFPRIRVVDQLKNTLTYARKVKMVEGEDKNYVYMRAKFTLRPFLRWHTLKLPKPEYTRKGIPFYNRKTVKVKNGIPGIEWRRMPSTMDIITPEINLFWNSVENVYELSSERLDRYVEDTDSYRTKSLSTIKRLAHNVHEAVMGDHYLVKDHMQTGITLRRREEKKEELKPSITPFKPETKDEKVINPMVEDKHLDKGLQEIEEFLDGLEEVNEDGE